MRCPGRGDKPADLGGTAGLSVGKSAEGDLFDALTLPVTLPDMWRPHYEIANRRLTQRQGEYVFHCGCGAVGHDGLERIAR